jgi:uncharacterized protein (UPF0333 family)
LWTVKRARKRGYLMPTIDEFLLLFIVIVVMVGMVWFIKEAQD